MPEQANTRPKKVLVIGLDGANPDIIKRLAQDGTMPFMKSVLDRGALGNLKSVYPPLTPPAWTTFMTGKNPGKHGIFEFAAYESYDKPLGIVNSNTIKSDTLWSILNRENKKQIVVNVPLTYPPAQIDGAMITGFLTPSTQVNFTHPPDLYDRLRTELGEYIIEVSIRHYSRFRFPQCIKALKRSAVQRTRYCRKLLQTYNWDFFMMVYSENDFLQHVAWSYLDPDDDRDRNPKYIKLTYDYMRFLDEQIQQLCESADDDTLVMFVSDHGFGPLRKIVYINTWLEQEGFLTYQMKNVNQQRRLIEFRELLRNIDIWDLLYKLPYPKGKRRDNVANIRWDRTRAFSMLAGEQGIRINLKGRESNGIVNPGSEYEQLRDDIIGRLKELRDPETGKLIGNDVHKREDVYTGPYCNRACDIVFLLDEGNYLGEVFPGRDVFAPTTWTQGSGTHRLKGTLAAYGPGIRNHASLDNAQLQDILPTLLYAMNLPVPNDLDGRILKELFNDKFVSENPPRYGSPHQPHNTNATTSQQNEQNDRLVVERLKSLGYIK